MGSLIFSRADAVFVTEPTWSSVLVLLQMADLRFRVKALPSSLVDKRSVFVYRAIVTVALSRAENYAECFGHKRDWA